MKRTHLLSTAALAWALLAAAAPAPAQRAGTGDMPAPGPMPHSRGAADADRTQRGEGAEGAEGAPAELLRRAQSAMRNGQAPQANDLLERAETRLLTGVEPAKPVQGEPAFHIAEARRALVSRDRAEAMRHTNMAIATFRDGGGFAATGSDAGGGRAVQGGGPGTVDSGMGAGSGSGRAVVRDGGMAGTSVNRADGVVLAQSDTGGRRGAPTGLPPGDTLPGWSGPPRSGTAGTPSQQGLAPTPAPPPIGGSAAGLPPPAAGLPGITSGPSSSSIIGGEPARVGGAPPGDTSRSPGSSGIGGAGVGGPLR